MWMWLHELQRSPLYKRCHEPTKERLRKRVWQIWRRSSTRADRRRESIHGLRRDKKEVHK